MMLPRFKNVWTSVTSEMAFVEVLVFGRYVVLAWIPSGYVADTEI